MYRIKISGNFLVILNDVDQSEHARHPLKDCDYEQFDELTNNPLIRFTGINKSFGIKSGNQSEFRFNKLLDNAGVAFTSFSTLSDLLDDNLGKSSPDTGAALEWGEITGDINTQQDLVDLVKLKNWGYLAIHWDTAPTLNTTIATGDVYDYTLDGVTRYRHVPSTYNASRDSFYETFDGTTLSDLITSRT